MPLFWLFIIIVNLIFGIGNVVLWLDGEGTYHLIVALIEVFVIVLAAKMLGILEEQ